MFKIDEIEGHSTIKELHALWDSVVTKFDSDFTLPFNQEAWEFFGVNSQRIQSENPRDSFTELEKPISEWHIESGKLAREFVYAGIEENKTPSDDYI